MGKLDGKRIAFLATDGVEEVELTEPLKAVTDAGADVDLISLQKGEFQGFDHLDKDERFTADKAVSDADAKDYDGLVLPGGVANPDFLRADKDAVRFVRSFVEAKKPVGAICHGPWTLVEADVIKGRTLTSWPSLQTDIRNAGATWVDEEVHVDQGLVTSRKPDDLPAFCAKIVEEFAEGRHEKAPEPAGTGAGTG
jgi:protease I